MLYSIRSERLLMEQLEYNLLFRWFVGLGIDDRCGSPRCSRRIGTGCCKAKWRRKFLRSRARAGPRAGLLSSEHFSVDGTLIEAWASQKSFRRKDHPDDGSDDEAGNPTVNFQASAGATRRTSRRRIPMRVWRARKGQTSHWPIWGIC